MSLLKIENSGTFEESYLDFNSFCIAKNLSEYTIIAYRRVKEHLIKFMGGNFELSELTKEKINEYIAYCRSNGNNDISVNTKLRHIRAMYNFFAERGLCEPVQFKMLKTTKRIKETYSDLELKILLERPNLKKCDFDDLRNWAVTSYLLATQDIIDSIEYLKEINPARYKMIAEGLFVSQDKLIYPNFEVRDFNVREVEGIYVYGLDYGYSNDPTAFIAAKVDLKNKIIYIFDEFARRELTNDAIARMIISLGYGKEFIIADAAEPKSNEELRRHGIARINTQ